MIETMNTTRAEMAIAEPVKVKSIEVSATEYDRGNIEVQVCIEDTEGNRKWLLVEDYEDRASEETMKRDALEFLATLELDRSGVEVKFEFDYIDWGQRHEPDWS